MSGLMLTANADVAAVSAVLPLSPDELIACSMIVGATTAALSSIGFVLGSRAKPIGRTAGATDQRRGANDGGLLWICGIMFIRRNHRVNEWGYVTQKTCPVTDKRASVES